MTSWCERATARPCGTGAAALWPELTRRFPEEATTGLDQAETRGREIVRRAEEQAREIVEAARQQAAGVLREAHREGTLQGRAEGAEAAREQLAAVRGELLALLRTLRGAEAAARGRATELVVELATALAGRLLEREIAQDPAAMEAAVRVALAALPAPGQACVRVHPAVQPLLAAVWAGEAAGAEIKLAADPELPLTACLVESGVALVDAGFSAQLSEARRRLLEAAQ